MGNCCGTASHEDEGHQMKPTKTSGQTLGGNNNETGKEAMLAAAEQRRIQAENRGVKKEGGGKLSKQLAEQNKQSNAPLAKDERDNKLVWD
ncbi:hypothetical protein K501DRAFT_242900 [Backusella circina FSU 941]|nr:hypothetical protein K501DRAFT_242900 [Backusella circina FSU 941]